MEEDRSVRVLHVDDDEDVLEVTRAYLELEGLTVETATSADEGLDRLQAGGIDCTVSDYDMPGTDGLEFLTVVRERGLEVPFVLFTGHGNEAVASEAISAGVTDYLQKGTGGEQYEVLANRIRNYADQHRTEREIERVRRWYELVARAVSDVIYEWDSDRDHVAISSGYAEHFGTDPPDDADVGWWLENVHPEDRERVKARTDEAVERRERSVTVEYRFEHADGGYRHVSEDRHHVFDDDGTVTRVVGAFRDVTNRRRRERRLDALHEASRDLMTAETVDEVVTTVSQAAEEILDLRAHTVFRLTDCGLVPEISTDHAEELFDGVPTIDRGDGLVWDAVESGEVESYAGVSDQEGLLNPDTEIRSEFYVPIADFGVFVAGSTAPDDFAEADVTLVKVLVANAEAALARVDD